MQLNHFTAGQNLTGIARYGLTVGDVPTDLAANMGRIGIWLTTSPESGGLGLEGSAVDKTRFRVEVDINPDNPYLVRWTDWAAANVTSATRDALRRTADTEDGWFVFFGIVPASKVLRVIDMTGGEEISDWVTTWPDWDSTPGVPPWRRNAWHKKLLKQVASRLG